jgi:hypothetical protein
MNTDHLGIAIAVCNELVGAAAPWWRRRSTPAGCAEQRGVAAERLRTSTRPASASMPRSTATGTVSQGVTSPAGTAAWM